MKTRMISSETHIHVLGNPSDVPFLEYFREIERIFRYLLSHMCECRSIYQSQNLNLN